MSEHFRSAVSRDLTPGERDLLYWMLRCAAPDSSDLLEQIPYLRVVGECTCGCPTIDLALATGVSGSGASGVVADALGMSPEGAEVNVIVHASNGGISELEVYAVGSDTSVSLPDVSTMRLWSDPAA